MITSFMIRDPDLSFCARVPDLKSRTHSAHSNPSHELIFAPSKDRSTGRQLWDMKHSARGNLLDGRLAD